MFQRDHSELIPGTLDLLVLKAVAHGRKHGYGIAEHVNTVSRSVLRVGESSLYPALQRLLLDGFVKAEWGISENNDGRATTPSLPPVASSSRWNSRDSKRVVRAIQLVLSHA